MRMTTTEWLICAGFLEEYAYDQTLSCDFIQVYVERDILSAFVPKYDLKIAVHAPNVKRGTMLLRRALSRAKSRPGHVYLVDETTELLVTEAEFEAKVIRAGL